MICNSWIWKKELARRAKALSKRKTQRRWPDASLASVEFDMFVSAYIIRKLMDSVKLSDEMESTSIPAVSYRSNKDGVITDIQNWHKIEELYNLGKRDSIKVSLREFCNQFIHSFVFIISFTSRNGFGGALVSSDHSRSKQLLYFSIDDIIKTINRVAKDCIRCISSKRDKVTGEMKVVKKSNNVQSSMLQK